ncbi:hypothetical protein E2C01_050924 [Portunus trituberculatus]|uniref:Uncharacterized protein n=1 Tax=Portunus trituberculatus TaxID=210409 RepID=A0A5B7GH93_PORTR|nr:hypothetical protein [Portunus trituberculatus]
MRERQREPRQRGRPLAVLKRRLSTEARTTYVHLQIYPPPSFPHHPSSANLSSTMHPTILKLGRKLRYATLLKHNNSGNL